MVKKKKTARRTYVLLTGGTGLIGSHLAEMLLKKNIKVVIPYRHERKDSYLFTQKIAQKVILQKADISKKSQIFKLIQSYPIDYIIHLAAQTTVTRAYVNPVETLITNIMGTVNLLEATRLQNSIKGIIIASSDKAYGKTKKTYTEDTPLRGDHPYDVSKTSADYISQTYFKTYKTPVVIARFGNVYGEGDLHFDRIIPGICTAIIKNKTLTIRSNGKYIRDYLYVKDVAKGYMTLFKNIDKIHGEVYNFSSKETLSVLDLIHKIEKIMHTRIKYKIANHSHNEIPFQHLDDSKIRKLGWRNEHDLESSFKTVLQWYKKILG